MTRELPKTPAEAAARLTAASPVPWRPADPVLSALETGGHEAWLVGGVVRDTLLARPPGIPDLATDATPERMMAILPHPVPTGLRHGTVTSIVEGNPVEVTTFRADGDYSDARHPDSVRFVRSIGEDLARRDFTINAMAFAPARGEFLDPFGGLADLTKGIIRAVGDLETRFREDGLRAFRAIRFAVELDFEIEPATFAAIGATLDGSRRVAAERIREEFDRMIRAPRPSRAIEMLRRSGLLAIVLPELLESVGVDQNRWHAWDVYAHTLHVLDAAPADKRDVRLAALLHDIGKPRTKVVVNGEGTFYNHQHVGAEMSREILARLRYPNETIERVSALVDHHMFHYQGEWTDAAVRRFLKRVGPDRIADLFDLRIADAMGKGPEAFFPGDLLELRERVEREMARDSALDVGDLAIDGGDVMRELGLPPGREVGEALRWLLEQVLDDPGLNTREGLLERLRRKFRQSP